MAGGRPSGRPGQARRSNGTTDLCSGQAPSCARSSASPTLFPVAEDADGYGPRPGQSEIDRLLEDVRELSPAGIERIAGGWDRHSNGVLKEAEAQALRALEAEGRTQQWDDLRSRLLGLTEQGEPLVAWRSEHGPVGHKAEEALIAAALGVTAGDTLDRRHRDALLRPMAEALPWLL